MKCLPFTCMFYIVPESAGSGLCRGIHRLSMFIISLLMALPQWRPPSLVHSSFDVCNSQVRSF